MLRAASWKLAVNRVAKGIRAALFVRSQFIFHLGWLAQVARVQPERRHLRFCALRFAILHGALAQAAIVIYQLYPPCCLPHVASTCYLHQYPAELQWMQRC